ncbi:hypothetical protein JHK86_052289 [Glycine max]|nr:hypothetical protein JHK86_052289 [Glycine max]
MPQPNEDRVHSNDSICDMFDFDRVEEEDEEIELQQLQSTALKRAWIVDVIGLPHRCTGNHRRSMVGQLHRCCRKQRRRKEPSYIGA